MSTSMGQCFGVDLLFSWLKFNFRFQLQNKQQKMRSVCISYRVNVFLSLRLLFVFIWVAILSSNIECMQRFIIFSLADFYFFREATRLLNHCYYRNRRNGGQNSLMMAMWNDKLHQIAYHHTPQHRRPQFSQKNYMTMHKKLINKKNIGWYVLIHLLMKSKKNRIAHKIRLARALTTHTCAWLQEKETWGRARDSA